MKAPKLELVRGDRIEAFLRDRAEKEPPRRGLYGGDDYKPTSEDVLRTAIDRIDYQNGWFNKPEEQGKAVKTVCKRCCKEYETAQAVWIAIKSAVYAFPGSEDDALAALQRALDELDVEEKLAPLLKEEFKDQVHKFLASRAIFAKRGGRYKAKQYMQHWADGYMAAWEKFDGARVHQRPYVLTPKYGNGCSGVAYLLAIPPDQLLKEAEEAFSVHLVMSV